MAKGQLRFKQRDLTRALRAASAAGQPVQRFEIDREGKIVVVFVGKPEQREEAGGNEWDNI
jgi:ribosome-interacting GTPase 1